MMRMILTLTLNFLWPTIDEQVLEDVHPKRFGQDLYSHDLRVYRSFTH